MRRITGFGGVGLWGMILLAAGGCHSNWMSDWPPQRMDRELSNLVGTYRNAPCNNSIRSLWHVLTASPSGNWSNPGDLVEIARGDGRLLVRLHRQGKCVDEATVNYGHRGTHLHLDSSVRTQGTVPLAGRVFTYDTDIAVDSRGWLHARVTKDRKKVVLFTVAGPLKGDEDDSVFERVEEERR